MCQCRVRWEAVCNAVKQKRVKWRLFINQVTPPCAILFPWHVNKEYAPHLARRQCLQPFVGSRFGQSITQLAFDPVLLTPDGLNVLAAAFPRVSSLTFDDECLCAPRPFADSQRLVSMSLCVAAALWKDLSCVGVSEIITYGATPDVEDFPYFERMKDLLMPLIVSMEANNRPLKLSLSIFDGGGFTWENWDFDLAKDAWMDLREEWERWKSITGTAQCVMIEPV